MIGDLQLSPILLMTGIVAGTLAAFYLVFHGWTPLGRFFRDRWRAYQLWVDEELRVLYSPMRARAFFVRHLLYIAVGFSLGLFLNPLCAIAFGAFTGYVPILQLKVQRHKRRQKLDEQLDSVLQSMANTILVTQNLEDAFVTIAQHFDPPIATEADILVKQVRLGTPMDDALRDFAVRCESRNVDAIVTALTVGRKTGGELPKVLETTASVLRETMRVEGVMAAKTSEGKAQVIVMGALPFFFGGVLQLINPEWMYPLFHDPIGYGVLLVACLLEGFGVVMVRKLSRIEV